MSFPQDEQNLSDTKENLGEVSTGEYLEQQELSQCLWGETGTSTLDRNSIIYILKLKSGQPPWCFRFTVRTLSWRAFIQLHKEMCVRMNVHCNIIGN